MIIWVNYYYDYVGKFDEDQDLLSEWVIVV
jgi:hypothetical protein